MKKTALVLATVGALAVGTIGTATPAKAWHGGWGWGPGIAGGLLAGAVIGGIASSAYGWGPGYGYYGGYAPAYYGGYYGPYTYAPAYAYAPAYGYRYRRVFRPAYAYYGGPYRHHGGIIAGTIGKPRLRIGCADERRRIRPARKKPPRERRLLR